MSDNLTVEQSSKELAVLKAATSVFLTHGFGAATTDMIQREAGVSKATMYACFPGKEAMFIAVIERQCAVMSESFRAIRMAPGDIAKTLTELGASYLRLILSPPALALFRVVAAEAPRIPELGRRFYLAGPRHADDKVTTVLTEAVQAGEIDVQTVGIDAAATLFLSLTRGKGQLECLTHPNARPSEAQIDYWVQLAVTSFLRAFGTKRARR
jgi:AcrR family transcriptional regulator